MLAFKTAMPSKSTAENSESPRWLTFWRAVTISARMRAWYSGCFANSQIHQVRDKAVVSWPAKSKVLYIIMSH